MNNKAFYAYCRDNRNNTSFYGAERKALHAVYDFMRECGTSKAGVKQFVDHQSHQSEGKPLEIKAFQWLLSVFDGPSLAPKPVPDGQMQMF